MVNILVARPDRAMWLRFCASSIAGERYRELARTIQAARLKAPQISCSARVNRDFTKM
jgi:hypothetical protein